MIKNDKYSQEIIDFLVLNKKISLTAEEKTLLFKKASENRVLYEFCVKGKKNGLFNSVTEVDKIITDGDIYLKKLQTTLEYINKEFLSEKLVVKTNRIHKYITYDVDLLVKEPNAFLGKLSSRAHPQGGVRKQTNLIGENLLTIDLHNGFFWQGSEYLDMEEVWQNIRKVTIQGVSVLTPSREVEILINLAHLVFERRYLTLLEFWYFYDEFKKGLNFNFIFDQANKYQWNDSLQIALSVLETVSREFTKEKGLFSNEVLLRKHIAFPFFFTINEGLTIFKEKLIKKRELPIYDLCYYVFAYYRYLLSGKRLFPYYREWYRF